MMKQPFNFMPRIRRSTLLFVLPVWGGMSAVFVLIVGYMLFQSGASRIVANLVDPTQQAYHLFTTVPKKGDVLGQRIESNDLRVLKLQLFLNHYRSPMPVEAFITAADKYDLPWTLLPAIACKESGCGRVIPRGSYNAFGWAVYTGQNSGASFGSWDAAIDRVARGIRTEYFDKGFDTVPEIETKYTPPSARTHHGWQLDVEFFMETLEGWEV